MSNDHWKATNPADATLGSVLQVFPGYVMHRAKRGLLDAKTADGIIADVGEIETLQGGSKYALSLLDDSGTEYRVTVEVVS